MANIPLSSTSGFWQKLAEKEYDSGIISTTSTTKFSGDPSATWSIPNANEAQKQMEDAGRHLAEMQRKNAEEARKRELEEQRIEKLNKKNEQLRQKSPLYADYDPEAGF